MLKDIEPQGDIITAETFESRANTYALIILYKIKTTFSDH